MSDGALRAKARELIRSGGLPDRLPARRWGGRGDGRPCTVCGAPVGPHEIGFEIEFASSNGVGNHDFHDRCLRAFELELRERALAGQPGPAAAQTQPAGAAAGLDQPRPGA